MDLSAKVFFYLIKLQELCMLFSINAVTDGIFLWSSNTCALRRTNGILIFPVLRNILHLWVSNFTIYIGHLQGRAGLMIPNTSKCCDDVRFRFSQQCCCLGCYIML